jgi:hypothetical protein
MRTTPTDFRSHLYTWLDKVVATGEPLEIVRKGVVLQVSPVNKPSKLQRLQKHDIFRSDPNDLIHLDWSSEWNAD